MRNYVRHQRQAPVYAAWKCPFCGETNYAEGKLFYRLLAATSSTSQKRLQAVQQKLETKADEEWASYAFGVLIDPRYNGDALRSDLHLQAPRCTRCGRMPRWVGNQFLIRGGVPAFVIAVVSGFNAALAKDNWTLWLLFAASLIIALAALYEEFFFPWSVSKISDEHLPVMGTEDETVLALARGKGRQLPTPEEAFARVRDGKGYQPPTKTLLSPDALPSYCRMCGAPRRAEDERCPRCGE